MRRRVAVRLAITPEARPTQAVDIITRMNRVFHRALLTLACLLPVLTSSLVLTAPAQAATFTTRCVVARSMRIYHTAGSTKPGRTKLHFGKTIYTDRKRHH